MSQANKKDWERPWSIEEIVTHADNWNLACDAALLNTLKAFSDKILNRSEDVYKKVDKLCDNLDRTSLRVDLARNEFNSLRNSQFIECRVYEEDETLVTEIDKEVKAQNNVSKEETIDDMREAVALGLEILDQYYEKVEVTVSDSEDEDEDEAIPSYVYRRKDPYINRPLPYVIGSAEWYKKWHVGLQESSDSENEKSASDKFSDSESEDNLQMKDHSDVSSELSNISALNNVKGQPAAVSTANTTKYDDYLASTSGSDSSAAPTPKALNFAEQLAARLGNVIRENEGLLEEPEVNRRPIQKKSSSDYGALFTDEPPPLGDAAKEQESQGIFSGGKGLFDDEDDDETLWNPGKSNVSSRRQLGFNSSNNEPVTKSFQGKSLFDEDSDDDILVSSEKSSINSQIKQPYLRNTNKLVGPVFHEEPPLLEEERGIKEKKKPTGGVSVFGDANMFQNQKIGNILKQRMSSSASESNEEPAPSVNVENKPKPTSVSSSVEKEIVSKTIKHKIINSNKQTISVVPKPIESVEEKLPKKQNSLFEDEEDTSIFETERPKIKKNNLFDDDIFGDDLFDNKFSSNLFRKEDLFSEIETTTPSNSKVTPLRTDSGITNTKESEPKEKHLSEIEQPPDIKNEYDYSWRKNSKSKIVSLFDDVDDDFDIFAAKKIEKKTNSGNIIEVQKPKASLIGVGKDETDKISKPKVSLFDDEFEEVDDLFSEIFKSNKKQTSTLLKPENKSIESEKSVQHKSDIIVEKPVVPQEAERPSSSKVHELKISSSNVNQAQPDRYEVKTESSNSTNVTSEKSEISIVPSIKTEEVEPLNLKSEVQDVEGSQNIENNQSQNSAIIIPHVNFLDSVPPPIDGWDNSSDNAFDDLEPYGNDDFQSQPSSLFDNEPPSLFFNDTSGILRDHVDNRFDSVNSFDPSLTSSRRLSSDIFGDNQVNDNLFLTNNQDSTNVTGQSNLQSVPEISDFYSECTDITPSGNPDDLYSSMTVNISNETNTFSVFDDSGPVEESSRPKESDAVSDFKSESAVNRNESRDNSKNSASKPEIKEKPNVDRLKSDVQVTENSKKDILSENSVETALRTKKITDKPAIAKRKPEVKSISTGKIENNDLSDDSGKRKKASFSVLDNIFDKDETDDLFSSGTGANDGVKISGGVISDKKIGEKRVLFDINVDKDESKVGEEGVQREDDEMQSNIAKIAEKLQQQISSNNKNQEKTNNLVPGKLSHTLNANAINVGALLPGSAPPRRDKLRSPEQHSENEVSISKPLPASRFSPAVNSEEEISVPGKLSDTLNAMTINVGTLLPGSAPPRRDKFRSPEQPSEGEVSLSKSLPASRFSAKVNSEEEISVPGKLSGTLNAMTINVGALLPGSAPPRRDKLRSPEEPSENEVSLSKSLPASRFSTELNIEEEISAVPGKLSDTLNAITINVGALLPGSAPPRRDKLPSPEESSENGGAVSKSVPASRFSSEVISEEEISGVSKKPKSILRTVSESDSTRKEYRLEKSISFDNTLQVEVLQSITKDRAKIPVKRRPSSRRARQELMRNSVPDFKLLDPSVSNEENAGVKTKNPPEIFQEDDLIKSNLQNIEELESEEQDNKQRVVINEEKEENQSDVIYKENIFKEVSNVSLFGDEEEDVFKTIQRDVKNVNHAQIINTNKKENIFTEDIFTVTRIKSRNKPLDDNIEVLPESEDLFSRKKLDEIEKKVDDISTNSENIFHKEEDNFAKIISSQATLSGAKKRILDNLFDSSGDSEDFFKNIDVNIEGSKGEIPISETSKVLDEDSSTTLSHKLKLTKNLFDSSDEDDFLESLGSRSSKENITLVKPVPSKSLGRALFDDENDDDDIFGTSSWSNKNKRDIQPPVINKKTPKSSNLRKLENIEGHEDPLSALLK